MTDEKAVPIKCVAKYLDIVSDENQKVAMVKVNNIRYNYFVPRLKGSTDGEHYTWIGILCTNFEMASVSYCYII